MTTTVTMHIGDVRDVLAELEDAGSPVDLAVTSPPFLALRSYLPADHPDKHREIGSEPTPAAFLDTLYGLTAQVGQLLPDWGSFCVELGDTMSGSGGAGGDYNADGLRRGQPKAKGSARFRTGYVAVEANGKRHAPLTRDAPVEYQTGTPGGPGWPLAKSMCLMPHAYTIGLAYGHNPLTGTPSPAGQWRIRNVICWARPNPPVGSLGKRNPLARTGDQKFRPATSYITVACRGTARYFDLDAVRTPHNPNNHRPDPALGLTERQHKAAANPLRGDGPVTSNTGNPAGAPPLDWHTDDLDGDWLWRLPTAPYRGSHYATFPLTLPRRLIQAMCPARVCDTCGWPSERITEQSPEYAEHRSQFDYSGERDDRLSLGLGRSGRRGSDRSPADMRTLGWTDCGHDVMSCRTCNALVPYDHAAQGPGATQGGEAPVSDEALLGEPVAGAHQQADASEDVRGVPDRLPRPDGDDASVLAELLGEAGPRGGTTPDGAVTDQRRATPDRQRVRPGVGSGGHTGPTEERLHDGAPDGDANASRPGARAVGDRSPSQRGEGRQQDREPGSGDEGAARRNGDVPPLSAHVQGELTCATCGSHDVEVRPAWRPGVVLDPFGGSGTTAVAAALEHRDAVLIDIDHRNIELVRRRLGETVRVVAERRKVRQRGNPSGYRGTRRDIARTTRVDWTVEVVTAVQLAEHRAGQLDIFADAGAVA